MLLNQGLIALAVSLAIPLSFTAKVLPRGPHSAIEFPVSAGVYGHDVTVNISDRPDAIPRPRQRLPGIQVQQHPISSESNLAKVRRTLLGARQSCRYADQTACIGDAWCCNPGYNCCGAYNCYPLGGDCCADTSTCDVGLVCVIFNGKVGCCTDYSCSELQVDPGTGDSTSSDDESFPTTTSSLLPHSVTRVSTTPRSSLTDNTTPSAETKTAPIHSTVSTPTGAARATASSSTAYSSSSVGTGTSKATGSGSSAPAGPKPARLAWAMGLTAAAMVVGAGMIRL